MDVQTHSTRVNPQLYNRFHVPRPDGSSTQGGATSVSNAVIFGSGAVSAGRKHWRYKKASRDNISRWDKSINSCDRDEEALWKRVMKYS
jgi:hypothetical protein